jgi:hypothetical protein
MKSGPLILLTVFAVFTAGLFPFLDAAADDKTCVLKADDNLHVVVWDEDSDEDRQGKIYSGKLEPGDRYDIKSKTGFIVFSYRRADDDRSYGDNHRKCKNGNTIRVP